VNEKSGVSDVLRRGPHLTLSRRDLTKSGLALGLSASAITALLTTARTTSAAAQEIAADAPKPDELRVLYVGVEANVDSMNYAAQKYGDEMGIKVTVDSFPQTSMREKLFAELSSQSPYYDVVLIDHPWGAATAPHLLDLRPLMANPEITDPAVLAIDDFVPQTWAQVAYDQTKPPVPPMEFQLPEFLVSGPMDLDDAMGSNLALCGLPFHPNVLTMAYRLDYFEDPELQAKFEEANGRELTPPEDWDEFVEVTQFFTQSHNPDSPTPYGATLMAKKHESLYTDWRVWNRTFGVVEINEKLEPTFNSEDGIAATSFYGDLINEYKVVPPEATTWTWDEVTTAFGSGQTAIAMNYHRMLLDPDIEAKGGKVGFAKVPGKRQEDGTILRAPHYGTYYLGLNRYAKNPRWAYDLILTATSPDWMKEYSQFLFHGSRVSYYEDPEVIATRPEYWPTFAESLHIGYALPRISVYVEYSETIQAEVSRYLLGEQSVEDALNNAATKIRELFERNNYYQFVE
jgi:multiple sugar transport system substrate-binding protein